MNVAAFIVAAINIHQIIEKSSSFACNVGHSFLSFSHLIIYLIHEFYYITSHDEILSLGHFLRVVIIKLP